MSFKMRDRPKKPDYPSTASEEIGYEVPIPILLNKLQEFLKKHEDLNIEDLTLSVDEHYSSGWTIYVEAPASSMSDYEKKLEQYKENYKEYTTWRKENKKAIEKHNAEAKVKREKTKLENRLARLKKETEQVEKKLDK